MVVYSLVMAHSLHEQCIRVHMRNTLCPSIKLCMQGAYVRWVPNIVCVLLYALPLMLQKQVLISIGCLFSMDNDVAMCLSLQIEEDAYQEDLGFSTGQLGKGGISGTVRGPAVDKKTQVSISKRLQVQYMVCVTVLLIACVYKQVCSLHLFHILWIKVYKVQYRWFLYLS